ncbi:uncharacterized protein LOC141641109 [Silene latifolia]|uniref:uncharacterized protein LOC141641109 n=1 Tax=Silene latifolia TaxID=37657 RepID=UPI003D777A67
MNEVLKKGPWTLGPNSLVLKQWTPYFSTIMECVTTVPIWILFPHLDPYMWIDSILSKMSSKIGKPLFADLNTTCKAKLSFARVMIEVDVSKDLPDSITINAPYIGHSHQRIIYEWLPYYCHTCKKLGHTTATYKRNKTSSEGAPKKKGVSKKVFKPVTKPAAIQDQSVVNDASKCHLLGGTSGYGDVPSETLHVEGNSECIVLEQTVAIEDPGGTILSPNKFSPLGTSKEAEACSAPRTSEVVTVPPVKPVQ